MPGCDIGVDNREIPFDQLWLPNAIPSTNGRIDSCFRYALKNETNFGNVQCSAEMFDENVKIACSEYIYASDERNLQTEVKSI